MINDREKSELIKGLFDKMPHEKKYEVIAITPEILCNFPNWKKRELMKESELIFFIREYPC